MEKAKKVTKTDKSKVFKIGNLEDKKVKKIKKTKNKEKVPFKVAIREFPIKMARDISRIKWVGKGILGKRFIATLLFIIGFGICYAIVDQGLSAFFKAVNII